MDIDVLIEDERWEKVSIRELSLNVFDVTLRYLGLDPQVCEASVLACDDSKIAELNRDFRSKDKPTNVLSWPAQERGTPNKTPPLPVAGFDGMIELGDLAISYDTFEREAEAAAIPFEHHVTHLLVHGILHLLGYDHIFDTDAEIMELKEVEVLEILSIPNPY